ncbi:MAG: glycosyltransferase [Candidatus Saccharimonadia bacterium]
MPALAGELETNRFGQVFSSGDVSDLVRQIKQLLASPAERLKLGQAAQNHILHEHSDQTIHHILTKVYQAL